MMNLFICVLALVACESGIQASESHNHNQDDVQADVLALKARFQEMTGDLLRMTEKLQQIGVNYIRWGRTECPDTADKLYQGYAAKSYYRQTGGGAEYICLHNDPQQPEGGAGVSGYFSSIYGVEYSAIAGEAGEANLLHHDAPCVACVVTSRSQMIMIPGRTTCNVGWTLEYHGALVAEHISHTKSTYVCLDRNPEALPGSGADHDGGLFYTVEAVCNHAALCPPYITGLEIACAVCTK